jgi:nucleoside-diphosphate-sugar epimerase
VTKVVAEQVARSYAALHGMSTIALRLGMFVPETFERYGFRLLFGGVDDRDVGQAVAAALDAEPAHGFEAVDVMADCGLSAEDVPRLEHDLAGLLEERWPGTLALVREHGLDLGELVWGRLLFPVDRARALIGYAPRYDFAAFLQAWRRGDSGHYPYAHEPWWGAERPT